jgi:hypothetical protein
MRIKALLPVVAVVMLPSPPAAVAAGNAAGGAAGGGSAGPHALALPADAPVPFPSDACGTTVLWVAPHGAERGHYTDSCPHPAWVPARGPAGIRSSSATGSCVRWVAPRGVEGGHYVATCGQRPRWVPALGPAGGHYEYAASAIAPTNTPITAQSQANEGPSWGFDWGSAGIGAATVFGAVAIGIATLTEVRRRRMARPPTAITQ